MKFKYDILAAKITLLMMEEGLDIKQGLGLLRYMFKNMKKLLK